MGKQNEKAELTGKAKEDYDKRVAAQSKPAEKKRKVLTPEERIAKAEAELAALVKKEQARKDKAKNAAREQVAKRNTQINELVAKNEQVFDLFPELREEFAPAPADKAKAS